jgi:hypothetical protein
MDHLITKHDLDCSMQSIALRLGTLERQQTEEHRQLLENEQRWQNLTRQLNRRTVLSSAAITSLGIIIVAIIQTIDNHSFAVAREKVREMNRQDRLEELQALKNHDDIVIRRTSDEIERRVQGLLIKAK